MVSVVDPRPSSFMRLELLSSMTVGTAAPTRTPADCCDRYFPKGTELSVYRAGSCCHELFGNPALCATASRSGDWTFSPCCARYASASPHTLTGTGVGPPPTAWAMPASPGRVRVRRLARECMAVRELPRGFFLAESRKGVLIGGTGSCDEVREREARVPFIDTVDLVNQLEAEARGAKRAGSPRSWRAQTS